MEFELVAPKDFIAEGVEAENLLTLFEHPPRVIADLGVEAGLFSSFCFGVTIRLAQTSVGQVQQPEGDENQQRGCPYQLYGSRDGKGSAAVTSALNLSVEGCVGLLRVVFHVPLPPLGIRKDQTALSRPSAERGARHRGFAPAMRRCYVLPQPSSIQTDFLGGNHF